MRTRVRENNNCFWISRSVLFSKLNKNNNNYNDDRIAYFWGKDNCFQLCLKHDKFCHLNS